MVYIDADSFASLARERVELLCLKHKIDLLVVANHNINVANGINFVLVENGKDMADNYILGLVKADDVVLSRDLLLLEQALLKKCRVMNDFGDELNLNTIKNKLIERKINYNLALADKGFRGSEKSYNKEHASKFEKAFKNLLKIF